MTFLEYIQSTVAPVTGGNHEVTKLSAPTGKLRLTRTDNKSEFLYHYYNIVKSNAILCQYQPNVNINDNIFVRSRCTNGHR